MTRGTVGRAGLTKRGYGAGKGQSPFSMGTGKEGCPRRRRRTHWKADPHLPAVTALCLWPPFSRSAPEPPCHGDSGAAAHRVTPTHTSGENPACLESFHRSLGNVAPTPPPHAAARREGQPAACRGGVQGTGQESAKCQPAVSNPSRITRIGGQRQVGHAEWGS